MSLELEKMKLVYEEPEKRIVCISGGKKCLFFGKLGVLCFLETPVLRFTLLPYYRRNTENLMQKGICNQGNIKLPKLDLTKFHGNYRVAIEILKER